MSKKSLFWLGWTIWICMVVLKICMVFGDYPDFCWDPMFLMVPFLFIVLGGIPYTEPERKCKCKHCREKEKEE